jgi:CTP synthase
MQMAVIEFSRNILKLDGANSTEMDLKTKYPVIDIMDDQKNIINKGGTMRLGSWECKLKKNSLVSKIYNCDTIHERHRHRYEFNSKYFKDIEEKGMSMTGINSDTELVEIIELKNHPWFVGVQFHPEYKSTVLSPHPLFVSFIAAAVKHSNN